MRRPRLFWRIFATYLVVIVLCVAAVGALAFTAAARLLPRQTDRGPAGARRAGARADRPPAGRRGPRADPATRRAAGRRLGTRFTVISGGSGGAARHSAGGVGDDARRAGQPQRPTRVQGGDAGSIPDGRSATAPRSARRRCTSPSLSRRTAAWSAAVRAAMPLATVDDALPALYWRIGVGAAIVAAAAALIGLFVSGGISRQMRLVRRRRRRGSPTATSATSCPCRARRSSPRSRRA